MAISRAPTAASQSLWYKFNYIGGNKQVTTTLTFQPADSTRLDVFYLHGRPEQPEPVAASRRRSTATRARSTSATLAVRAWCSSKSKTTTPTARSASSARSTPTSTIATPTPTSASNPATPQVTPTAGPVGGQRGQRDPDRDQRWRVLGHAVARPGGLVPRLLRQPWRRHDDQHLGRARARTTPT